MTTIKLTKDNMYEFMDTIIKKLHEKEELNISLDEQSELEWSEYEQRLYEEGMEDFQNGKDISLDEYLEKRGEVYKKIGRKN